VPKKPRPIFRPEVYGRRSRQEQDSFALHALPDDPVTAIHNKLRLTFALKPQDKRSAAR
jgi:hypothetical protein